MGREPGNPQLEDGFTRVANEILEAIAQISLSDYESRCVHFLWRKTWGWQDKHGNSKKSDAIAHSQWSKGTNIARRHVPRVLDRLVQRNIFSKQTFHIGGKKIIAWSFNKYYLQWLTPLFEPPLESIISELPPLRGATRHEVPPIQGAKQSQVPPIQDQLPPKQGAKLPPKQGTTKDNKDTIQKIYYNGEEDVLKLLKVLKGWKYEEEEDLEWWRSFRADNNGAGLSDIKACQDYFSGMGAPKHKGVWKNRFRNWLIKKQEFVDKGVRSVGKMGVRRPGKVPTTDELKAQAKKKGVL